jgi:hypothetical protein
MFQLIGRLGCAILGSVATLNGAAHIAQDESKPLDRLKGMAKVIMGLCVLSIAFNGSAK